jgi:hypothetical protein
MNNFQARFVLARNLWIVFSPNFGPNHTYCELDDFLEVLVLLPKFYNALSARKIIDMPEMLDIEPVNWAYSALYEVVVREKIVDLAFK